MKCWVLTGDIYYVLPLSVLIINYFVKAMKFKIWALIRFIISERSPAKSCLYELLLKPFGNISTKFIFRLYQPKTLFYVLFDVNN